MNLKIPVRETIGHAFFSGSFHFSFPEHQPVWFYCQIRAWETPQPESAWRTESRVQMSSCRTTFRGFTGCLQKLDPEKIVGFFLAFLPKGATNLRNTCLFLQKASDPLRDPESVRKAGPPPCQQQHIRRREGPSRMALYNVLPGHWTLPSVHQADKKKRHEPTALDLSMVGLMGQAMIFQQSWKWTMSRIGTQTESLYLPKPSGRPIVSFHRGFPK